MQNNLVQKVKTVEGEFLYSSQKNTYTFFSVDQSVWIDGISIYPLHTGNPVKVKYYVLKFEGHKTLTDGEDTVQVTNETGAVQELLFNTPIQIEPHVEYYVYASYVELGSNCEIYHSRDKKKHNTCDGILFKFWDLSSTSSHPRVPEIIFRKKASA